MAVQVKSQKGSSTVSSDQRLDYDIDLGESSVSASANSALQQASSENAVSSTLDLDDNKATFFYNGIEFAARGVEHEGIEYLNIRDTSPNEGPYQTEAGELVADVTIGWKKDTVNPDTLDLNSSQYDHIPVNNVSYSELLASLWSVVTVSHIDKFPIKARA